MEDTQLEMLEKKMNELAENKQISCASLLKLAGELHVPPKTLGNLANRLKIKICHCQLGCFP